MLANKNGHKGGGMEHEEGRTMAEIAADILDLGPFLPGTVRRDFRKYVGKDGRERQYEVQPRVNLKVGERRVDTRIPKEMFAHVKKLTENYARFRALVAELEEAAAREHLPGVKKKA